jgi:hypothetical protein
MTRARLLAVLFIFLGPALCPADPPREAGKAEADPFGYTAAFDAELLKVGQISPQEFARRYSGKAVYLEKITWDPTTATFWDKFNFDPAQLPPPQGRHKYGRDDFRLNKEELALFKQNGFVVSERMGGASFGEVFYRVYNRDLPVFLSADALLHAWHRSYDTMLEELEEGYLAGSLDEILSGMAEAVDAAHKAYGKGVLAESVTDADYFLAVARSLLGGSPVRTRLDQGARVARTLAAVDGLRLERFDLFGRERKVDFSQFKVRGHYEHSEQLKRYFRAMMWCGRIDLRVAGDPRHAAPREMGAALVLDDLLKRSGKFEQWQQFDRMIQTFVGKTDSMTFAQLDGVLDKAGIKSPADVKDLAALEKVQGDVLAGKIGVQHIRSHAYASSPFGPDKVQLPRSFTLLGQKFVLDSWVTAKVVADDVMWDEGKVQRRVPSCLDVAFAALGNDQVVPELVARMQDRSGREFRDGLNYQHNLAAVRNIIDAQDKAVWEENLYQNWLACLRELSVPTTDGKYPEVMRTRAWAMKSVNTQLASWTQLRHDSILYVKQSYTAEAECYYPAGFVEPIPHFWARLQKTASLAADLIEKTPYPDRVDARTGTPLKVMQARQASFFRTFAEYTARVKLLAEKELAQKEFTADEVKFLEDTVRVDRGSGSVTYNGWYTRLFYKGPEDCGRWDALVADVHTDVPAPILGDPGCVLTQGVGNVDLLLVAVDNGKDRMVYAGPVLSHYEFEMPGMTRKADSEWRNEINAGRLPPRPAWTKSYLVPGENPRAKMYRGE